MRVPFILIAALALAAAALPIGAPADDQPSGPPVRIRGTIESFDGQALVIKSRGGSDVMVKLVPNFTVGTVKAAKLADIKIGDFIGSAAAKGQDGNLHALEVHIFPEAMRGTGEGQRPWDAGPDSSMTNATVGEVMALDAGARALKLTYQGGEAEIVVAPDAPIVTLERGEAGMLQPGRTLILFALHLGDGSLVANRVTVESGGVKPPM